MRLRLLVITVFICLVDVLGAAQARLMCDVECGPDPTVTGYTTVVASRTAVINQRTGRQPLHIVSRLPFMVRSLQASQSYDYSVNLLSLRGRNGLDVNLSLSYNSRIWSRSSSGLALNADLDNPSYGFRGIDFGFIQKNSSAADFIVTTRSGAKSELFAVSGTTLYQSHDSTYLQFDSSTNILVAKDGTQTFYTSFADGTVFRPTKVENTNGNYITLNYLDSSDLCLSSIIDTLGRTVSFSYNASGKLASISQGTKTIIFTWNTAYILNYNFSLPVVGSAASGSTQSVLSSVKFADGTSVNFLYGDWGIVNRIERRSTTGALRGYVSYNFPAASAGALNDAPGFTQQTMFDGVNTAIWNYGVSKNSSGLVTSFAITDPSQVTTTTTFSANGDWQDGLPLGEQITDSSGKLWRKTVRTWTADNTTTGVNPHLASVVTQSDDGTQSQINYAYDVNGNITDVKEFDFAAGAPGPLLRETATSFASLGNHILNRASQILVKDGSGNIIARTDFAYDQYSSLPLKPLNPAAVQHDDVNYSTAPTAARGNLTTKTVYSNAAAGTGAIASTFTYDIAGNKVAAQVGCCTQASSIFSSLTQYAFPDSVIIGPAGSQLTASFTYNFNTGTVATSTDANGQITSFAYDVNDRTTSVHTPDGVTTSTAFDDSSANSSTTSSNSADSQVVKVTKDFDGHVLSQQVLNGTALVSTVTSTHDVLGRLLQISNPYGPSDTAAYTTYSYDPLGREVQATAPALVSGTAQGSSFTAFSGHTTTHTDPAGRQRREYRNALGQIIQVDEPGDPFAGTPSGGTLPVNGSLRSTVVGGQNATQATGSLTITGFEESATIDPCSTGATSPAGAITPGAANAPIGNAIPIGGGSCPKTIFDRGTVTITVNGHSDSAGYGSGSTTTTVATGLANAINADTAAVVTASSSGSTLFLTAKQTGPGGNYSWSVSSASTDTTGNFGPGGSFNASPTSGALSGGANAVPGTTVFDSGAVSVSVGSFTGQAVPYGSTTAIDVRFTNDSCTACSGTAGGGDRNLFVNSITVGTTTILPTDPSVSYVGAPCNATSNGVGSLFCNGDLDVTTSATGQPITVSAYGSPDAGVYPTMQLLVNGTLVGQWTVTGSAQNYTVSVPAGDTAAGQLASALAATLNVSSSPVTASVSGSSIVINYKSVGTGGNVAAKINSAPSNPNLFPGGSFSGSTSLAGGQDSYPSGVTHPNSTQYSYNALGLLTQVTQGQQVRRFNYDSLGRLTSQNLPEKANLGDAFTYTDFGAVATRTDARGVKATYSYDPLGRISNILYSDGTPTITYTYGAAGAPNFAAGRVAKITDGAGSESYQYDVMGRVIQCTRVIGSNTYVTNYSYALDGRLASMTYPSGRVVTDQYDNIGRLTQVGTGGSSLLNVSSYNAAGQALGFTYGNGTQATFTYNAQLQVASILYGSSTAPVLSLSYDWGGATDDGLLAGVTDNANSARSTSYSYDQLRRLAKAQTIDLASANTWSLQFTYDRYGNRLTQTPAGGTATMPSNQVAVDPTTNRITSSGYTYDADGDVTAEGGHTYTYDAEHRLIHVDGAANSYAYDGSGQRVNRNGNYYIYADGHVIAEYAAGATAASPTTEYIYARGKRVATIAAGATTYHYWDHTSIRSSANSTGGVVRTYGHYPFGETWYETGTPDKWKFTTYERDTESGLDYAMARFHSSRMGRFMSLDPWPAARHNPQSWNRYAYAKNNPVSLVDPSGMDACDEDCFDDGPDDGSDVGEMLGGDDGGGGGGSLDDSGDGSGGDSAGGDDGPGGQAQCGEDGTACDSQGNCLMGDCMPQNNNGGNDGNAPSDGSNNQGDADPNSQPGTDSGTGDSGQGTPGTTDDSNDQGNQQQPDQSVQQQDQQQQDQQQHEDQKKQMEAVGIGMDATAVLLGAGCIVLEPCGAIGVASVIIGAGGVALEVWLWGK